MRKRSEEDRRKQCVYLTENAWNIAEEVMDASVSPNKVLSEGISEAAMKTTYEVLIKMADNLGAPAGSAFVVFDEPVSYTHLFISGGVTFEFRCF